MAQPDTMAPDDWPLAGHAYTSTAPSFVVIQGGDGEATRLVPNHPAPSTQDAQAAIEGVLALDDSNSVEFLGERFRLADNVGLMPLLVFANSAKKGLDSGDLDGLAAMYVMIRDTVDQSRIQQHGADGEALYDDEGQPLWEGPSEWDRFEEHAINQKAEGEDLMDFIRQAMSVISARPRKPRGTSSDSSRPTSGNSKAVSSSPVTRPGVEGLVAVKDVGR